MSIVASTAEQILPRDHRWFYNRIVIAFQIKLSCFNGSSLKMMENALSNIKIGPGDFLTYYIILYIYIYTCYIIYIYIIYYIYVMYYICYRNYIYYTLYILYNIYYIYYRHIDKASEKRREIFVVLINYVFFLSIYFKSHI